MPDLDTNTVQARRQRRASTSEQREERIASAQRMLQNGIDALTTSEGWKAAVTSAAWLRRYSLNNILMILAQCPEATDVRPLSEWNAVGHYMRKGTHKIRIWKPTFRRLTADEHGTTSDDTNSPPAERALSGFMLVGVVDVSQLHDPPVTSRQPAPLEMRGGAPTGLWDGIAAQIHACEYRIEPGDCGSTYDWTRFTERVVRVRETIEPAQAAKTLVHELAHILCDHATRPEAPNDLREVEAESVACIVAAACGLDTLPYSVPYIAGWAGDRDTAYASAQRVHAVARMILTNLEGAVDTAPGQEA